MGFVVVSWVQGVTGRQVFNGMYPDICIFDLTASDDNSVHRRMGVNQRDIFSHRACPQKSKLQRVASLLDPPSRQLIICPRLLLWFNGPLVRPFNITCISPTCFVMIRKLKKVGTHEFLRVAHFRLRGPNCAKPQEKKTTTLYIHPL